MSSRYDGDWDDEYSRRDRYASEPYEDDRYEDDRYYSHGPNWKKAFGIILSLVLAVVVAGGGLVYYLGHSVISLSNYVSDAEQRIFTAEEVEAKQKEEEAAAAAEAGAVNAVAEAEQTAQEAVPAANEADKKSESADEHLDEIALEEETEGETKAHKGVALSKDELDALHKSMADVDNTVQTINNENVFNIVLTGVDRRDKSWNGNSDSMMLVSINNEKKRVSIISLMRDTYVNIPDVGYQKLNNAYARGGGKLMCQTISDNYNINVENYAAVDFENMIDIIDAIGGVELEWTDAEVQVSNGYMMDMCDTLGLNGSDYILPGAGTYQCNGVQAVAYARNRYVGNSDYARTERQRYVISQIIKTIYDMDAGSLAKFVLKVLPLITHNVKEDTIWELVTKAPEILNYDFVTDRVPYDNMYDVIYVGGQDMLVPYWEQTINQMNETIYGEGTVSKNSDNDQEDRTLNNMSTNEDFEFDILNGGAEEEQPVEADR